MIKVTTIESANLIATISDDICHLIGRNRSLKSAKAQALWRVNDGGDAAGEAKAFVEILTPIRTKTDAFAWGMEGAEAAKRFQEDFDRCQRADLTVKRCAEEGLNISREDVFATTTARLNKIYSVNEAIKELKRRHS